MRRGRPPYPELLTPREQQVLSLIRDGLTNEQIAVRLGLGFSGARYHVGQILSKLGVGSRQEAALWTPQAPDARKYGLFGGMLGRLMGFTFARAAAGLTLAVAVAMLGGLLVGTVTMRGREAQVSEPAATPGELSGSPLDQAKQALPPPFQNLPTPVPRPDESSALPVDAARRELSKNADLARVIAAAESGDIRTLLNLGQRADEAYCRVRQLPPECASQDDRVPAVYHDIGVRAARSFRMMGEWLGNMYADNSAKLTFASRDSRLVEGDGGKYYLVFTLSHPAVAGGPPEVGALALIVAPGTPHPVEIFTFFRPGGLGLAWVQEAADPNFLLLITPETVKDWPGRGPPSCTGQTGASVAC